MSFLQRIQNVNGTIYQWNEKMTELSGKEGYEYGLIAQQVQKEFPEMVSVEEDGYLSIDYIQMIPVLVQCVKELKQELDSIKTKINNIT